MVGFNDPYTAPAWGSASPYHGRGATVGGGHGKEAAGGMLIVASIIAIIIAMMMIVSTKKSSRVKDAGYMFFVLSLAGLGFGGFLLTRKGHHEQK